MERVILRYISLPPTIKGLTVQDNEGNYNVYLNARHTHESNLQTLHHEIQHIEKRDFSRFEHVKDIERR